MTEKVKNAINKTDITEGGMECVYLFEKCTYMQYSMMYSYCVFLHYLCLKDATVEAKTTQIDIQINLCS